MLAVALAIASSAAAQNGLPPLIDREIFFGNPEIASAQISPDGKFIAFRKPYKDTMNLWVKKADEPFDKARLITAETQRPIRNYFWSRDSKYILFVNDFGGDENFNVYAVDPTAAPAAGSEVPATRNLTDMKKVRALHLRCSANRSRRDLHRLEQSRSALARPLQTPHLNRRAAVGQREHGTLRRIRVSTTPESFVSQKE